MKITVVSDLHLEFAFFHEQLPGGDVCLLAGDIFTAKYMRPESGHRCYGNWQKFYNEQLTKYQKVYAIMGNHEHYGSAYSMTKCTLDEATDGQITILDDDSVDLSDDVVLFGSTFWTDFNNADWFAMQHAKGSMNDYNYIKWIEKNGNWRRIHPHDIFAINIESRLALQNFLIENSNKKCIVMTHHCPTFESSHPKWGGTGNQMNYAYCNTQLENLILDSHNLKYWIHGHTHETHVYGVGDHCKVICNPRGYSNGRENENPDFDPNFYIEV